MTDIRAVCATVYDFVAMADIRCNKPVITLEFDTIDQFYHAKRYFIQNIDPLYRSEMKTHGDSIWEMGPVEGVIIRLVCKQRLMTRRGPYGAAEVS